jgi:hypothetical protein
MTPTVAHDGPMTTPLDTMTSAAATPPIDRFISVLKSKLTTRAQQRLIDACTATDVDAALVGELTKLLKEIHDAP